MVYLGSGFDFGDEHEQDLPDAPADWTPWEFERACCNLHRLQHVRRVETGPVEDRARLRHDDQDVRRRRLLKALEQEGVDTIFGIPGGASMPIYDLLVDRSPIRHILCRHEQGAGHAAEGYAGDRQGRRLHGHERASATNLVTPLADAKMDSVPIVAITGQVPTPVVGNDAFQEADITGITIPVTKHNFS